MILAIFLVSLLAVSAVSAADNTTKNIDVEKTDEILSVDENQLILRENNDKGTFTDLANEIANAGSQLNLDKNYHFTENDSEEYKYGIKIEKSIVINGNGHTIDGQYQAAIFDISGSNVILNNISFMHFSSDNMGSAVHWSGANGILANSSFYYGSSNVGGAVFWSGANGILANSSFLDTYAGSFGGAVYWSGADGVLANSSFENINSNGYSGGAIDWGGARGTLSNCSFVRCYIRGVSEWDSGGAIIWDGAYGTLSNSNFINCSSRYYGGSIDWRGKYGYLYGCNFMNSEVIYRDGGAVRWSGQNGVVYNSTFTNNKANRYGGGIYFESADCSLVTSNFEGNYAPDGSDWYNQTQLNVINETPLTTNLPTIINIPQNTITFEIIIFFIDFFIKYYNLLRNI